QGLAPFRAFWPIPRARRQKEAPSSSEESSQASPKGQRGNPGREAEPCQAVTRRAAGHQQRGRTKRPSGSAARAEAPRASWERERLRWRVLVEPRDDAPRLVLADWLEENGASWERRMGWFARSQVFGPFDLRVSGLQHPRGVRAAVRAFKAMGIGHELARAHWLGVEALTFRRGF